MSDATIVVVVSSVNSLLLAILAAFVKIWSDRQNENHRETTKAIEVVRNDVNGKMEHMQEIIKTAAIAEGKLAGIAEEKANPS